MKEATLRFGPVQVTSSFLLVLCLALYVEDGSLWLLYYLAALFHELGHTGVAWLWRLKIASLRLSLSGAELVIPGRKNLSPAAEALLLLAGPGANLVLAALELWAWGNASHFAEINLMLAGFNLLPVRPLDGGELLCLILSTGFPSVDAGRTAWQAGRIITFFLCVIGMVSAWRGNPTLLILSLWLWLSNC